MGRIYTIESHAVSVSAVQDLLAVYAGAMPFILHEVEIGQITQTTIANLNLSFRRLPATVTTGSGGSSVTPQKALPGDAAATVTARANDTVQATTSGTLSRRKSTVFNPINGYYLAVPPRLLGTFNANEALVLSLDTAPASAIVLSVTATIEEIG